MTYEELAKIVIMMSGAGFLIGFIPLFFGLAFSGIVNIFKKA